MNAAAKDGQSMTLGDPVLEPRCFVSNDGLKWLENVVVVTLV